MSRATATIQIRDVSEDAYEVIRRRARASGQSIQAYMKKQVERMASEPDEHELFSELERFVEAHGIRLDVEALLAIERSVPDHDLITAI